MRTVIALLGIGLSGCLFHEEPPLEIEIVSPETGYLVDHHDPIVLQVYVKGGVTVDALTLSLDGVVDPGIAVTPRPEGQFCDPCSFRITWPATYVGEGSHVVEISALADESMRRGETIEMVFDDKPQFASIVPAANADLLGVGLAHVEVSVVERGQATATLAIDGVTQAPQTDNACRGVACTFTWAWDTTSSAPGPHELELAVSDANGNTIRNTRTVYLDDTVKITSIEVTGIDEHPTMEIEVYLFDDITNELLGCAGSAHGLLPVDHPDVRYTVDARLINVGGTPLHGSDIASRMLRFEVWEDDDGPVCPTPISPTGNNLVAKSAGASYEAWKTRSTPAAFGTVVELGTLFGRPLVQ